MQELYTLISTLPSYLQIFILVLLLIGGYVVWKFRTLVLTISAGAIAMFIAFKRKDK